MVATNGRGAGGKSRQAAKRPGGRKKRSSSSTRWLQRQHSDIYVAEARRQGYRSRAAFKLEELDSRFQLINAADRVADLGAAPGGWTQVAVLRSGAKRGEGRVVAVDCQAMEPVAGAVILRLDMREEEAAESVKEALGGLADVVLSDMAAPSTGHAATDHLRIVALAETALDFAEEVLRPGGTFVVKVFQGGAERELLERVRQHFASVRHAKPPASRKESAETYLVAKGFRP
jgi:23S rRNA (uridine2552-2'-O)-methyltransferase